MSADCCRPTDFAYDQEELGSNNMVRTIKTSWLAFKLDCPIKYGLEAVAINYQKETSRRLVLLI